MTQQVKTPTARTDYMSSIPGTHMVERKMLLDTPHTRAAGEKSRGREREGKY